MTTRLAIIEAALQILDGYGLGDLSMRRVAEAADIAAASIYWHFANKQTLLAAVSDVILAELAPLGAADDVATWVGLLRARLLAHRDGAELVASSLALGLSEHDPARQLADVLTNQLGREPAGVVARVLLNFVLGHVMQEQSRSQLVALGVLAFEGSALDEEGFVAGVRLILAGAGVQQ